MMHLRTIRDACRRVSVALVPITFLPIVVHAQFVRGTVNDRAGLPVSGVISSLLESTATVVAKALSNDRGEFSMRAPRAGTYTLRSLRIGYSATVSMPFVVPGESAVTPKVVLDDARLELQTIRVAAKAVCQSRPTLGAQTFALWEQARGAISATDLNAVSRSMYATTVVYDRVMEGSGKRIKRQEIATRSGVVTQPWTTLSVDSLMKVGYVTNVGDTVVYVAPGLDMLASDEFLAGHCLRLAQSPDTSQIGIAFEPVSNRKGYADIRGTLWLDRNSAELRQIEFGYTNIPEGQMRLAGGDIRLARLKNGGWAISRWAIRMPIFSQQTAARSYAGPDMVLAEMHTTGGELALITTRSSARGHTLWSHPPLVMRGTVADSLSGKMVAGARVSLLGTTFSAVTNSAGEFAINGVLPGEYTADVRSPALSKVGTASIASITFLDSTSRIAVRVATPAQVLATICPSSGSNRTTGALLGVVSAGATAEPAAGVRVMAQWREMQLNTTGNSARVDRPAR